MPTETQDGTYVTQKNTSEEDVKDLLRLRSGDYEALAAVAEKSVESAPWDDRTYLMEHIIDVSML